MEVKSTVHAHSGTFATQCYKEGEVILFEKPLCILDKEDLMTSFHALDLEVQGKVNQLFFPPQDDQRKEGKKNQIELIYKCNAFEGGILYERASRFNHSCDPNCFYHISDDKNEITIKAVIEIKEGDELCISYLGILLWTDKKTRQNFLQDTKLFRCSCNRCCKINDLAGAIVCPCCHEREHVLSEEVMWEEIDVAYSYPTTTLTETDNKYACQKCGETFEDSSSCSSLILLSQKVVDKVVQRISSLSFSQSVAAVSKINNNNYKQSSAEAMNLDDELDQQLYQMAVSLLGGKHWTTNIMLLSLLDRSLSTFNAAILLGEEADFEELAESIDSLDRLYSFADGLQLKVGPPFLLLKQTVGVSRSLVALGDVKSQKYASEWISRVANHAKYFEDESMNKVVTAIASAWKHKDPGGTGGRRKMTVEAAPMMQSKTDDDDDDDDGEEMLGTGNRKRVKK